MNTPRKELTVFDDYREMLSDTVRMRAFERAISSTVKPNDVVVDLGAGLGILSLMAVKAGAKKVYAIEMRDSIRLAKMAAKENGFEDKIEFISGNSQEIELPEKADVLLSETLGSFAVDENTLEFTADAKKRFLKPNGKLIPEGLELFLCPVEYPEGIERANFWKDVSGFKFDTAYNTCISKMMLAEIRAPQLLSTPQTYAKLNLYQNETPFLENNMKFNFERRGTVHGLGGWFTAKLTDEVSISTAPFEPATHWKQAFFPFQKPVHINSTDHIELILQIRPKEKFGDDTVVDYRYFCSQNEPVKAERNEPCPCGSGKKFKKCHGR